LVGVVVVVELLFFCFGVVDVSFVGFVSILTQTTLGGGGGGGKKKEVMLRRWRWWMKRKTRKNRRKEKGYWLICCRCRCLFERRRD